MRLCIFTTWNCLVVCNQLDSIFCSSCPKCGETVHETLEHLLLMCRIWQALKIKIFNAPTGLLVEVEVGRLLGWKFRDGTVANTGSPAARENTVKTSAESGIEYTLKCAQFLAKALYSTIGSEAGKE